jgi:isocitrate dehydrogenase
VSLYWAEFMAAVDPDFQVLATSLKENRQQIVEELKACQGKSVDVGGYYKIDNKLAEAVMRPSPTQNKILDGKM